MFVATPRKLVEHRSMTFQDEWRSAVVMGFLMLRRLSESILEVALTGLLGHVLVEKIVKRIHSPTRFENGCASRRASQCSC